MLRADDGLSAWASDASSCGSGRASPVPRPTSYRAPSPGRPLSLRPRGAPSPAPSAGGDGDTPARCRVAVRVRPFLQAELDAAEGGDPASALEVMPELGRLTLRRTAWETAPETFGFDAVFDERASQASPLPWQSIA
jgi:hypothetical protein